jgi:hypothetical protein
VSGQLGMLFALGILPYKESTVFLLAGGSSVTRATAREGTKDPVKLDHGIGSVPSLRIAR